LEKIAIGATGTRRTFEDLGRQGHNPVELERGSMSFKIWKAIKIKRVRVPDILCLRCGHRVESRAKTKVEITMSHSTSVQERGWDYGLDDKDLIALVHCTRTGPSPLDWSASPLVQYISVRKLRRSWRANKTVTQRPKGAQEGFEIRVTWPAALASDSGIVERVDNDSICYRKSTDGRAVTVRLNRRHARLSPLVAQGDQVQPSQVLAAVVPVTSVCPCAGGADVHTYIRLSSSSSLSDRYTAAKALGRYPDRAATDTLVQRVRDTREHIYVRVDAAAGLMRRQQPSGQEFLAATLQDIYLENRLEAAIVLGEVATSEAAQLLMATLRDTEQHPEIRAGAAWSLGEVGAREALPALVESFTGLETVIKIEAARALAKLARKHVREVIQVFPGSTPEQRPGIAWALSKAGGFSITQLLPVLSDDDARHWVSYMIGTQDREAMLSDIEALASRDPQVYFAVTVLWKIISSWVYELEEY
jgi:hypothetical protein